MLYIIKENGKVFELLILFNELEDNHDCNIPKCLFYHLDFRNGSCHFSAHILWSRSNVKVLEFMGPTKILSRVVASLRIFDIRTV